MAVDVSVAAPGAPPPRPRAGLTTGGLRVRLCLFSETHGDEMRCNLMQSPPQRLAKVISELLGWVVLGTASLTADPPDACLPLSQR